MSFFRKREPPASGSGAELPRAAVCFPSPALTRRAADWMRTLGGCRPFGILSDDCGDVVWQCEREQADLLLMMADFSGEAEEPRDITACCSVAIEVKRQLPACRVYLICEDGYPKKQAALEKAAELELIDGCCIGDLTARQMRAWLCETAEAMKAARCRDFHQPGKEEP